MKINYACFTLVFAVAALAGGAAHAARTITIENPMRVQGDVTVDGVLKSGASGPQGTLPMGPYTNCPPLSLGALKAVATNALARMNAFLPGGAGTNLQAAIAAWTNDGVDEAPVNLGQLKHLVSLFYDRIMAEGLAQKYPWPEFPEVNDFAAANAAQAAFLLSLPELSDTDFDNLPDWWERRYFGDLSRDGSGDADGDGATDAMEYAHQTNPGDAASYIGFTVAGTVSYAGPQTGSVHVVAIRASDGATIRSTVTNAPGDYQMTRVPESVPYLFKAYRDSNGNGSNDAWEAVGVFSTNALPLSADRSAVNIGLLDPDTDADSLPDWWERQYFGDLSRDGSGDADGDGVTDALEYAHQTNPGDAASYIGFTVAGTVLYAGPQTGSVHVVAIRASDGATIRSTVTNEPGGYQMTRVPESVPCLFKAYRDSNGNGSNDAWEAVGVFSTNALSLSADRSAVNIGLLDPDTDSDSLPDWWERQYFGDLSRDGSGDADGDGLSNLGEYGAGTDPGNPASHCWALSGRVDYGGSQTGAIHVLVCSSSTGWTAVAQATIMTTGSYAVANLPPNSNYWVKAWRDTDGNGTNDSWEAWGAYTNHSIALFTNVTGVNFALTDPDSDGDGLPDWWELKNGLDPLNGGGADGVAWWKFDEGNGTNIQDSTTNKNNGTVNGAAGAPWTVGIISNALLLDGTNACVEVPDSASLDPAFVSLGLWIRPTQTYTNGMVTTLLGKTPATAASGYALAYTDGGLAFTIGSSGTKTLWYACALTAAVPVHVAATYGGPWQRLYVNGSLVAQTNYDWETGFGFITENTNAVRLGAPADAMPTNFFTGLLDDVRVYGGEWTTNQIRAIYELGVDPDGDELGNAEEFRNGTDPHNSDTDGDGMPDGWEVAHNLNPLVTDSTLDPDQDGLTNLQEYQHGTDPHKLDTDGDGMSDGWEVAHNLNPLLNDSALDPDHDGLTNLQEYQHGTDPHNSDTDGDGIGDGAEVQAGTNPTVFDAFARLPFLERFETNTTHVGDINGQHGWTATVSNTVMVQTGVVWEGEQALAIRSSAGNVEVHQLFAETNAQVVWMDAHVVAQATLVPTNLPAFSAALFFDKGYPVAYDGLSAGSNKWVTLTNLPPFALTGEWVRLTIKLDYDTQRWLVCLNGLLAGEGLGFAAPRTHFEMMAIHGQSGGMDALSVGTNQPPGLSLDGDRLPDDWEVASFGNLEQADNGDPDQDGLTNLQEYQHGTDPLNPDTDGDGMPDGWEVAHSLNPSAATDGAQDADQDGLSNLGEYGAGTDPGNPASHCWALSGRVDYGGSQTGAIRVLVCSSSTGWTAVAQATIMTTGSYAVANLPPNSSYWVKAWRDTDGNGTNDSWEAWGAYTNHSIALFTNVTGVNFALTDPDSDSDGDGLPDWWEVAHSLNRLVNDSTLDPDQDGITNLQEYQRGTDPLNPDTDGDGMPDGWEVAHSLNPSAAADGAQDADQDGLANAAEYARGTDMRVADTDGDGLSDGAEVNTYLTNPQAADTDGDGMPDGGELAQGLDPVNAADGAQDADQDGLANAAEYTLGTDMHVADTDGDGLSDGAEVTTYGTDPLTMDTDGDGLSDGAEVNAGTDPRDANSHPFTAWSHNMKLSFRNSVLPPLTNFPVLVVLNPTRVNYAEFQAGGAGLLFHAPDGTALAHEIEQWDTNGTSFVWVNAPLISGTGDFMTMRWGNAAATNRPAPAGVWNGDYVGVWHLADADNTVADSTRFAWNGYNRGADSVAGPVGRARHFDGASHIGLPADSLQTVGNGVSVSVWLRGDDARCPIGIAFHASRNFTSVMTAEMLDRWGKVDWIAYNEANKCQKVPQTADYENKWNHWVFVKNPANGTMTIYLNGQSWATASGMTNAYEIADTFRLGSDHVGSIGYHGSIDEFRVAAKPLSPDWVTAEYRAMTDKLLIYGDTEVTIQAGRNGAEPGTNGTFIVRRSVPAALPLTVTYAVSGDARSGVDFTVLPGSVVIPAGATQTVITVPVPQNNMAVSTQLSLTLTLTDGDYVTSPASNSATITITGSAAGGDPSKADSDGDGMSDAWESANSLNPTNAADAALDTDGDGVLNLDEYRHDLNPRVAVQDTDGDGLPDSEEIYVFGTDPTQADTDSDGTNDMTAVVTLAGAETSYRFGAWTETNGILVALTNRNMRAEYQLTPPTPGMYRLVTRLKNAAPGAPAATLRIQVLMDQTPVQWLDVNVPAGTNAVGIMVTPWLTARTDTLRLAWLDDGAANKLLGIMSVQLQRIDGASTNGTGRQDWMETILAQGRDTDADGLSDRDEVAVHHTDPILPDTDGDTLNDGDEVNLFQTDPLAGNSGVSLACQLDGTNTVARYYWAENSEWYEDGSTLVSPEQWGSAVYAYEVTLTNAGMHRLAMQVRAMGFQNSPALSDLPDEYRFGVRVTIDGCYVDVMKLVADKDRSGISYLTLPWLVAGKHTIEVQWQDWFSYWLYYLNGQILRRTALGIEQLRFYTVDGPDANTNGVPDWMERAVEPALDTDGDGLSDAAEMLIHHTNPLNPDTDGDGLTDSEEAALASDPNTADTDHDGVLDGEEALELHTNPFQAEFDGTVTTRLVIPGAATNAAAGRWTLDGSEILAQDARGWVQYGFECPQADIYRVVVEATHVVNASQCSPVAPVAESDLLIYVDGRYVGKKRLVAPQGVYGTVTLFTPYLAVGPHTLNVYWENVNSRVSLKIKRLLLQQYGGADANANGVKDWVEISLGNANKIGTVHAIPSTLAAGQSCVSPVCIEGAGSYVDMMNVSVNGATNVAVARNGAGDTWYADVPLSATGATDIAVSFQNGTLTRSTNVAWVALNVIGASDLTLRRNDSILLTALPADASNGTVTLSVLQETTVLTNIVTTADHPVAYNFASAGTCMVNAVWSDGGGSATGSIAVTVIGGSFPAEAPACMIGYTRQWACTNLPADAVMEADDTVSVLWTNRMALLSMSAINKDHHLVARLPALGEAGGGAKGPILASTRLDGFWMQAAVDSYLWVVETYPDGSALWETTLIAKNLPPTVAVELKIIVGGVTFDDMTLQRWITAANLNALGQYTFRMIKPASIGGSTCHTIRAYQGGVSLGEAYYGGILMPKE